MFRKMNTFTKMMIIIFFLLVPIIALYSYSNHVSSRVVEEQLIQSSFNRMSVFLDQMDDVSEQIWRSAYTTMQDDNAIRLQSEVIDERNFEAMIAKGRMEDLMRQQINSLPWDIRLTLFIPSTKVVVTTSSGMKHDLAYFQQSFSPVWTYRLLPHSEGGEPYFIRHMARPFSLETETANMSFILEAAIPANQLSVLLQQLKAGTSGEPMLYHPAHEPIVSPTADAAQAAIFHAELNKLELEAEGHQIIRIGRSSYLMNYAQSESLGWQLVDFIPLEMIMQPIRSNMELFYMTTGLLLLIALISAALVYRNVQMPIHQLTRGVQRLARGEYAYRVNEKKSDEFAFLFSQFNAMSDEIQRLIEKVYFEQINVREAKLRQLQSQINPHFLYNNFNFIQSMTQMGNKEAAIAFTQHLSHYYRYTTYTGEDFSSLREELELVRSYLEIHKMQMGRLHYYIDVPDQLLERRLPRLLLQPIVENAIVHGIENRLGQGSIHITGEKTPVGMNIVVKDNGIGMQAEQLRRLMTSLEDEAGLQENCGLWNVHQRLKHAFSTRSGLIIEQVQEGGLQVTIQIVGLD